MHQRISSGTLDSPSWNLVRTAKLAAHIYAPLGTRMALGDYVRVTKTFLEAFKTLEDHLEVKDVHGGENKLKDGELAQLCHDLKVRNLPEPMSPLTAGCRHIRTSYRAGVLKMTAYGGH
jgi:glycerol-3-phosphate O-acyltransferase/dihydroxyacetone phosphate acyltransferase